MKINLQNPIIIAVLGLAAYANSASLLEPRDDTATIPSGPSKEVATHMRNAWVKLFRKQGCSTDHYDASADSAEMYLNKGEEKICVAPFKTEGDAAALVVHTGKFGKAELFSTDTCASESSMGVFKPGDGEPSCSARICITKNTKDVYDKVKGVKLTDKDEGARFCYVNDTCATRSSPPAPYSSGCMYYNAQGA